MWDLASRRAEVHSGTIYYNIYNENNNNNIKAKPGEKETGI